MKIISLLALLTASCLAEGETTLTALQVLSQIETESSSTTNPTQLTAEQDAALVEAGVLPPIDCTEPPPSISLCKFSPEGINSILACYDQSNELFFDFRSKEIAIWKTIDQDVAEREQAILQLMKKVSSLERELLEYRLQQKPVKINFDLYASGLIGFDMFDITKAEESKIGYTKRSEEFTTAINSIEPSGETLMQQLRLKKEHISKFQEIECPYMKKMSILDIQMGLEIEKFAQPIK